MIRHRLKAATLLLVVATAAASAAQAAPDPNDAAQALRAAIIPLAPKVAVADPYAQVRQSRSPGIATTSVDHSFAGKGLTGSAGFLCGIQPGQGQDGGAAAYGYDPHGRFLGAKLSLAFK